MIEGLFKEEEKNMSIIRNKRNVVLNFLYRLNNDLNVRGFFDKFHKNIEDFDSMERMKKIYFKNDIKAMCSALNYFYIGLNELTRFSNMNSAEELLQDCIILPDSGGKEVIRLLSYIPILDSFCEIFDDEEELLNKRNSMSEDSVLKLEKGIEKNKEIINFFIDIYKKTGIKESELKIGLEFINNNINQKKQMDSLFKNILSNMVKN